MYEEYPKLEMNTHVDSAGVADSVERPRRLRRSPTLIQDHSSPLTRLIVGFLMVLGIVALVNVFAHQANERSLDIDPFPY